MKRIVVPELLDSLPAEDVEALRTRRDLRRINFLMGNERWVLRTIRRFSGLAGRGITEIGAGDGFLCGKLAGLFPGARVTAYDLAPRPGNLTSSVVWEQGDLFEMPPPLSGGIVIANLFLHHFEGAALTALGKWMESYDVLIFNEPDRSRLAHLLGGLMHPWINRVTRHDMHVSITAGFTAGEIGTALGLCESLWRIEETSTWRGGRRVIASRHR